jgi:hypothetical protein
MTTLILPNEILNKIFSYIEGKHNRIIKKELIKSNDFWIYKSMTTVYSRTDMKFAIDTLKYNLLRDKTLSNNKIIEYNKYFKYSVLHRHREYLFYYIKDVLRKVIDEFDYYYRITYHVLQCLRETYIHEYNYENMIKKDYNTYFRYTILHENRKVVFNDIKRYSTKKHEICNKKLSAKILLKRGILFQKLNTKR